METIRIVKYPQHELNSFILIHPSNYKYQDGENYVLEDYGTGEYLGKKRLVHKETYKLIEIPNSYSYLAKDCDTKLLYTIFRKQFSKRLQDGNIHYYLDKNSLFDIMFFTSLQCILEDQKKLIKENLFVDNMKGKSLLSNKPLLNKNYCHESKFNHAKRRPYTKIEIENLIKQKRAIYIDKTLIYCENVEHYNRLNEEKRIVKNKR